MPKWVTTEEEVCRIARQIARQERGKAVFHPVAMVAYHPTREHGMAWAEVARTMGFL